LSLFFELINEPFLVIDLFPGIIFVLHGLHLLIGTHVVSALVHHVADILPLISLVSLVDRIVLLLAQVVFPELVLDGLHALSAGVVHAELGLLDHLSSMLLLLIQKLVLSLLPFLLLLNEHLLHIALVVPLAKVYKFLSLDRSLLDLLLGLLVLLLEHADPIPEELHIILDPTSQKDH
jgi:hypothetical protein